jgi:mannose-1-phosphate guanylyltransferase
MQFKEKPDPATAERYVQSGEYYWNSGMFVWRTETILGELARHLPDSHEKVTRIAEAWDRPEGARLAEELYPTLQKISIDFAVMEKAEQVLVVEMDCDWLDVGSWAALGSLIEADAKGNIVAAKNSALVEAEGNILVTDDEHLIAAIGVSDLIVVHSPDATLICRKQEAEKIKALVERLKQSYGQRYQ